MSRSGPPEKSEAADILPYIYVSYIQRTAESVRLREVEEGEGGQMRGRYESRRR